MEEGDARRPYHRLVFLPNQLRQAGEEILGTKNHFMMFGTDVLGQPASAG